MENFQDIRNSLSDFQNACNRNEDRNMIESRIGELNQLVNNLEGVDDQAYEYYKFLFCQQCTNFYQNVNETQKYTKYNNMKNKYLDGYQRYQDNNNPKELSSEHNSQLTDNYSSIIKGDNSAILNETILTDAIDVISINSDNNSEEVDSAIVITENEKKEALTLVNFSKKKCETHELGIMINGAGRIAQKGLEVAINLAKSVSCFGTLVIATGVAAYETANLLIKYFKLKKEVKNSDYLKEAKKMLIQQIKALGMKTFFSFGITSGCIIGGSILGSTMPGIGTFLGFLLGAIVGTILSYIADHVWQKLFLNESKLLAQCERDLDLHNYANVNQNKKYDLHTLEKVYKQKLTSLHPDKCVGYPELQNSNRFMIQQVQFSKEFIKQYNGWN